MSKIPYLDNKVFESIIIQFQNVKRERAKLKLIVDDLKDTSKRHPNATEALRSQKKAYKASMGEFDLCQKELSTAFYLLSQKIINWAQFNLIDADDALQECVLNCLEKIDRFDPIRGKGFNYFSTMIINSLKQLYRTSRNYNALKTKFKEFSEYTQNSSRKHHKRI